MRDFFTEEITQIREMVSRDPSYSELSDEQLKDRINAMLELRVKQCETVDPETAPIILLFPLKSERVLQIRYLSQFVDWVSWARSSRINLSRKL